MKTVNCQSPHNPPLSYGDCVRACLASMTEDDNFPHFFDGREPEDSWKAIRAYMATKGRKLAVFRVDDIEDMEDNNPDIPYMLIGKQVFGDCHAVVGMNGKIIHDPAVVKRELVKNPELQAWIVFIVI